MAEAIADPACAVLLPLAFFVHPKSCGKQENVDSKYIVPPEDDLHVVLISWRPLLHLSPKSCEDATIKNIRWILVLRAS